MPFDNGFFPPQAVASLFLKPYINLDFDDKGSTHRVCIKTEKYKDSKIGYGIKFKSSDYQYVDSMVEQQKHMNSYLDSTFGYYTSDVYHKFILAHYNWHDLADKSKSKGITDPAKNIPLINDMFNRRMERMLNLCHSARHVFFIYGEFQQYKFMQIDDEVYYLDDFSTLQAALKSLFSSFSILNIVSSK